MRLGNIELMEHTYMNRENKELRDIELKEHSYMSMSWGNIELREHNYVSWGNTDLRKHNYLIHMSWGNKELRDIELKEHNYMGWGNIELMEHRHAPLHGEGLYCSVEYCNLATITHSWVVSIYHAAVYLPLLWQYYCCN